MAKTNNKKQLHKPGSKTPPVEIKKGIKKSGFLEKTELYLSNNEKKVFWILFAISCLISLLSFSAKITVDGDDSVYIKRAFDFVHQGIFPTYQGALYPFFLSLLISIFGLNIMALKVASVLFFAAAFYFTYRAFKARIPYTVLFFILAFFGTNYLLQYYASQTYTESLFFMLQACTLIYIFKLIDLTKEGEFDLKKQWSAWLLAGFFMFTISITKNVALFNVLAIMVFFIIAKHYKGALYSLVSFLLFRLPYELVIKMIFGSASSSQIRYLKQKDYYNAAAGNEDLSGYFERFFTNFNHYISKHFFKFLDFRPENAMNDKTILTVLFSIIFLLTLIYIFKKNKQVLFVGIYTALMAFIIFISIQAYWDQTRIILVIAPLILLFLIYGFYILAEKRSFFRIYFYLIIIILLFLNLKNTFTKIEKNIPVLERNLAGDIYYGYTPDWVNFLKMSKWSSENLPAKSFVGSRKSGMSFVYGNGKSFYGIYNVPTNDADSLLAIYKKAGLTHLIVASLRADPKRVDPNNVISTVHRIVYAIYNKYPDKLKQVHQIGDSEPAYLYEIKY